MTELICIVCPRGCHLNVDEKQTVTGNSCKRGETYAISEVTNPVRTVTSTVWLDKGEIPRIPVKTSLPIPKSRIFEIMREIDRIRAVAPIKRGEVLLPNVLGLDSDIIASRSVNAR